MLERIDVDGGRFHMLPLGRLPSSRSWVFSASNRRRRYREIVNCEVNFVKEIEFEHFRRKSAAEEAEEIRMEFDKI